jgi:predicted NBD/HSP70 family sugar kinase/transcriptional regulator with XRE-family HTH domain
MTTLRDVARLAGVSTVTVSRVVNKSRTVKAETRAQVESAMAQLGVVPSKGGHSLGQKRSRADALLTVNVARSSREKSEVILPLPIGRRKVPPQETSSFPGDTARTMLRIVRAAQPISRVDLARRLEVNRSTVTELVTPLIASGVLREAAPAEAAHRRGRPPIGLTLRSNRSLVIGVNIGVRRTQVGAATTNGRMLDEESFDTPSDPNIALKQISSVIGRLRASMPERSLISIGVSVPGPTDAGRKKLLFAPHLGWRDVPVAETLIENEPGSKAVPVIVENDATAAAIYEARRRLRARTPKAQNNFILVRAGTGIGVGLVLGGEVYRGTGTDRGLLGEFGHMTIVAGGDLCACGNRGCWEIYASAAGAASIYLGAGTSAQSETAPRFIEIVERAREGELRAQTTLARIGANLGIGISNVITGLGVSRVVVSGRIVHGWEFLRNSLEEAMAQTMAGRLSSWSIEPGQPTGAGLGGALEVAIEHYLTELARTTRAAA